MHLFGTFDCSIDLKKRLSVPTSMRERISVDKDGRDYFVLPGRTRGTLAIFPDRYFLEQVTPKLTSGLELPDSLYEWLQYECSQTAFVEPDQQGRIVLPDWLLRRVGIETEVTLIGVLDHMELWRRDAYEAFVAQRSAEQARHRAAAAEELRKLASASASASATGGVGAAKPTE